MLVVIYETSWPYTQTHTHMHKTQYTIGEESETMKLYSLVIDFENIGAYRIYRFGYNGTPLGNDKWRIDWS